MLIQWKLWEINWKSGIDVNHSGKHTAPQDAEIPAGQSPRETESYDVAVIGLGPAGAPFPCFHSVLPAAESAGILRRLFSMLPRRCFLAAKATAHNRKRFTAMKRALPLLQLPAPNPSLSLTTEAELDIITVKKNSASHLRETRADKDRLFNLIERGFFVFDGMGSNGRKMK